MPTLTQIEYIIAVSRWKHFGKASDACHVSQPSLSMQIRKAEEELGLVLFDRDARPIQETEQGKQVIAEMQVLVDQYRVVMEMSQKDRGVVQGAFRLGVIPTVAPYLIPLFVDAFSSHYPKVELSIEELKTETILRELRDRQLDAGLLATPLEEPAVVERPLFYERFFVFVHPGHPLHRREQIHREDLQNEQEIWLMQDGHCIRNQVIQLCSRGKQSGVLSNIRFESGNLETLRYLVRKTSGYTLFPELFVRTLSVTEREKWVRSFSGVEPTREVSLIHRPGLWKREILQAIESEILRHLPKEIQRQRSGRAEVIPL